MPPALLNALILFLPLLSLVATLGLFWKYRSHGPLAAVALLPALICIALIFALGRNVGAILNTVVGGSLEAVSEEALVLHSESGVADLHADPLLFGRDLLERSDVGHVDIPRLQEGGVAVQVFSLLTRMPLGYNEEATDADQPDILTLIALTHLWPRSAIFNQHERVLYHARRLHDMAARSKGQFRLIRNRSDLEEVLKLRRQGQDVVGGLFALEGVQSLGDDFRADLDVFFEHGLRMASLTHFFDNDFGGSVQGMDKGGLTPKGRELIAEFERRGIVVDLAHSSHPTIDDVLAIARKPLVFSHTGIAGTCDQYHNLQDRHIKAIAANGGVIGIGLWDTAVCGTTAHDTVRAMRYVIDLVGDTHVGIGSDFDGYVRTHFDASHLPVLTQAMLDADFEHETIRRILGGNVHRVFRASLP
ncbi:MAG: membrane dipeptidase [Deltaproteobacteria bacterium]|nr:membrane dipeptidase [Deltaproteobacteria bacterium]MBW2726169.1 membrane dipeptidase [Deltaproteobacteria bacterium]